MFGRMETRPFLWDRSLQSLHGTRIGGAVSVVRLAVLVLLVGVVGDVDGSPLEYTVLIELTVAVDPTRRIFSIRSRIVLAVLTGILFVVTRWSSWSEQAHARVWQV